jgi:hypothetical protein
MAETDPTATAPTSTMPATMTKFQLDKYFEAIKQVGTANSAGVFGGVVALFYFKEWKTPVFPAIKCATGFYLAGLFFFVAAYCYFIRFVYKHASKTPPANMPDVVEANPPFDAMRNTAIISLLLWIVGTFVAARALWII